MKITATQSDLAGALRRVLSVVSPHSPIPALNNVLIQADENTVSFLATDLEVSVETKIEATVEEPGVTTLPARKFGQLVMNLPSGEVRLESDENRNTKVIYGDSFVRLLGFDPEEFPLEPEITDAWTFTIPCIEFKRMVSKVSYASSLNDPRQVLNGILLTFGEGSVSAVATDGKRLALIERPLDMEENPSGDVILPDKVVKELERLLGDDGELSVALSNTRAEFSFGNTRIVSKLLEGAYPNYKQVIPPEFAHSMVIPREPFLEVLNRVTLVVSESSAYVKLSVNGPKLTVEASSNEVGEASENMEISYEDEPVELSFNPYFLVDPVRHLECDQLILRFNDEFSPVGIQGDEGFIYVLMPMR